MSRRGGVVSASRRRGLSNNNATTLVMWGNMADYGNIIAKEMYGTSTPSTIENLTVWHNDRKVRGWIGSVPRHTPPTTYMISALSFSAGTSDVPINNWLADEDAYVADTGSYRSAVVQNAPFGHETIIRLYMINERYQTGSTGGATDGTPFWKWDQDGPWGTTGGAAAVAAGEGSAAWNTAVASALTPPTTVAYDGTRYTLCHNFRLICEAGASLGMTGVAWDAEGYGYNNKDSSMWAAAYPGKPGAQTEAQTRLWVKLRGQQLAKIQATYLPNSDIFFYHHRIVGGWFSLYRHALFGDSVNTFSGSVYDSFIAGLTSVSGIDKVSLLESEFYKNQVMSSWDNAYLYDHNGLLARLSGLFTDAERKDAMRRLGISGFLWPTSGSGSELGNAMTLEAFRTSLGYAVKWSMHRYVFCYAFTLSDAVQGGGNQTQDHAVFESAFQSELVPAVADSTVPTLTVTQGGSSSGAGATVTISGNATDNFCVHTIEWSNALTGGSGAFATTVQNNTSGWNPLNASQAPQNASIPIVIQRNFTASIPVSVGVNNITITALDTHGNSTSFVHTRTRTS